MPLRHSPPEAKAGAGAEGRTFNLLVLSEAPLPIGLQTHVVVLRDGIEPPFLGYRPRSYRLNDAEHGPCGESRTRLSRVEAWCLGRSATHGDVPPILEARNLFPKSSSDGLRLRSVRCGGSRIGRSAWIRTGMDRYAQVSRSVLFEPRTTRSPRLTQVSDGNPRRRLRMDSKAWFVVWVMMVCHTSSGVRVGEAVSLATTAE